MKKTNYVVNEGQFDLENTFLKNPLMALIKLARYKFPAKMLKKEDIVLDLGCGNGYSSYFFSEFCQQVTGVDLYTEIDKSHSQLIKHNVSFIKHDLTTPISQEIFDTKPTVVLAIDFIEHFTQQDGKEIINRYYDLLPKNGMMILGTPSKFSENYRSEESKHVHFHEYEPEELRTLCDEKFGRTLQFSMNDEVVHTGFDKLAWFFYIIAFKS